MDSNCVRHTSLELTRCRHITGITDVTGEFNGGPVSLGQFLYKPLKLFPISRDCLNGRHDPPQGGVVTLGGIT